VKRGVLVVVLALAALAALARAGGALEHVGPVAGGVAGETALLAACEPVGFGVPWISPASGVGVVGGEVEEEVGFEGLADAVTLAAMPWHEELAAAEDAVAGELPVYAALAAAEGVVAGGEPVYAALAGSAVELRVSPLLGPLDVWGEGPLGLLAREALAALDAGDVPGYLDKAADYWLGMEKALKRREAHRRGGRGTGADVEVGP
jgi:hypothetical protein